MGFFGHKMNGGGLHPTEDKLKAIRDAPRPKDVPALKAFLALIMFYSRTIHATSLNSSCTSTQPIEEGYALQMVQS